MAISERTPLYRPTANYDEKLSYEQWIRETFSRQLSFRQSAIV